MTLIEPDPTAPKLPMGSEELIQTWQERYTQAKMDRLPFEKQWHLNMSFFLGKQWVAWSTQDITPAARLLEYGQNNRKKPKLTINRIRLAVRKDFAKLNKERVRGYVLSASADDDDLAAARAGEKLSDYFQFKLKMARVMSQADMWCLVYGTSFLKHYYDPNAMGPDGPAPAINPLTGQPEFDPATGQPMMTQQPMLGMPALEAVSPFNLLVPNLDIQEMEQQDWVMHCVVRTRKQIMDIYGADVPDEGTVANNTADSRQQEAYGQQQAVRRRGVEVKEVWVKPCADYPEGLRFVWAGDTILQHEEGWPYDHGQYPFSRRIMTQSGRWYGISTVEDLIPLQIEYNAARSQLIENRNQTRVGYLAQRGSIDVRKMTNAPGQIIEYKAGTQPPVPVPPAQIPSYIVQLLEVVKIEMDEISSQNESAVPQGVEAAAAISYLMEAQDSVLQDTLRDKESQWERIISQFLSYTIQYWDARRTIKVVGKNLNFEAFTLASTDLRNNTDYRVEIGSASPVSRSAKQAQITELMKLGLPMDQALQHLELGDIAKLSEDMQIDERQAERENLKMSRGNPVPINPFDDHMVHIREHDNYRKREEAENGENNSAAILGNHVIRHLYRLAISMGFTVDMLGPTGMEEMGAVLGSDQTYDPLLEIKLRDFIITLQQGVPPQGQGAPAPSGQK